MSQTLVSEFKDDVVDVKVYHKDASDTSDDYRLVADYENVVDDYWLDNWQLFQLFNTHDEIAHWGKTIAKSYREGRAR